MTLDATMLRDVLTELTSPGVRHVWIKRYGEDPAPVRIGEGQSLLEYADCTGFRRAFLLSGWESWSRRMPDPAKIEPFACVEGLDQLPEGIRRGLLAMLAGAIQVILRHAGDPERGDRGWREQTLETHLMHARDHIESADNRCVGDVTCPVLSNDDDGLPHVDHATARIALYYARKRLVAK